MRGHGAEALSSPLPGKQTKGCGVSATHCTQRGADGVCNTLVPETGPPFWKPFLFPAIFWVNYNDLTATSLEIMVSKGNHPQMAQQFRLVKYYNLPSNIAAPIFGAGFWPHFWDHERANRSCSTVLTARISSMCLRQPSFCNASRHGHTHTFI